MNRFVTGHVPTRTSSAILNRILSNEDKYEVLTELSADLGKPWQIKEYENVEHYNVFWGEPGIATDREYTYSWSYGGIDWGISFHFARQRYASKGTKDPDTKYGTDINMDRLYYILVNRFNGGEDFVAEYLNMVAPSTIGDDVQRLMEPVLEQVENVRITRRGTKDRRAKVIRDLERGVGDWQSLSTEIEMMLKEDFKRAMLNGEVFINHINSWETIDKKIAVYGQDLGEFIGSGQFIDSIVFTLNMRIY